MSQMKEIQVFLFLLGWRPWTTKVMCRGSRKEVGTQFLATCHQSMGFWHLLFCHWNCATKWSCVIYSLYLVGGCWWRVELVFSGVGIKQRWEWQESLSLKATRRNWEEPTPDVAWLSLNVSSLEKEPPTHTVAMTIQESGWLLVHLFEVPLHSCGKYTWTLELSKVYCFGLETGQTEPTLGAIWNMFICAFTNPSLGHLLLSVLDAESCIHRLRNSVLWRMMQEFWGQPRLHSDIPYEKAKTKPQPPQKNKQTTKTNPETNH